MQDEYSAAATCRNAAQVAVRDRSGGHHCRYAMHFYPTATAAGVIQAEAAHVSAPEAERMHAALKRIARAEYRLQCGMLSVSNSYARGARQRNVDWAKLIAAIAAQRDREAFEQAFSHFAPRIKSMLIRQGTAPDLAEDLAQETMLAVWNKADQFDPSTKAVAAWIYTIARNLRIDAQRKSRPSATLDDPGYTTLVDEAARPDEIVEAQQDFARVRQALASLPSDQAEAMRNAYYLEMSQADMADALQAPLGTVKSRVRLALKRLRTLLDDDNAG